MIAMWFRRVLLCIALGHAVLVVAHPGQHEQLALINAQIERTPQLQALFIQRGMLYSEGGQFNEADADYRRALELGPPEPVFFELGVLSYRMGKYEDATDYLTRYLDQFPDYPPAYDYLARIARDQADYNSAVAYLRRYFRLQERPSPGHFESAARMLAEQQQYADALAVLDQGVAALGLIPQLQRHAIQLELARGRPELALARLETLRTMSRDSPDWKLDKADLLLQLGRAEEAVKLAQAAEEQLLSLKSTPARIELQRRAAELAQSPGG